MRHLVALLVITIFFASVNLVGALVILGLGKLAQAFITDANEISFLWSAIALIGLTAAIWFAIVVARLIDGRPRRDSARARG